MSNGKLQAFDPKGCQVELTETVDRKGAKTQKAKWTMAPLDTFDLPRVETLIRSGNRLYVGSTKKIEAIELPLPKEKGQKPVVSWQAEVGGTPASLLSADARLFAVTLEGQLLCFGAEKVEPKVYRLESRPLAPAAPWTAKARTILETTKVRDGYCIAWGVGSGQLLAELARQSNLTIIAVDPDGKKVEALRRQLIAAGLYGDRVAVHAGDPLTFSFPPTWRA